MPLRCCLNRFLHAFTCFHLVFQDAGVLAAGFYWVQQRHSGRSFVGQAPDAEADLFELMG